MKAFIEEVVNLTIASGASSGSVQFTPQPGKILGVKIFKAGGANDGLVNASVRGSNGDYLSRPQHIDNYRSREVAYMQDFKPMPYQGGSPLTWEIQATDTFSSDLVAQLIVVYAPIEDENCKDEEY